jgi:hypothetical protein
MSVGGFALVRMSEKQTIRLAFLVAFAAVLVLCALPQAAGAKEEIGKSPASLGIEAYSKHPSGEKPYFVCPPSAKMRPTCLAIDVPPAARQAARQEAKQRGLTPAFEGSGEKGGLSPADLRSAYKLPAAGGKGQTIAIVDAFDDPNAESDLATYRSHYGLSSCTTANGCFQKVNQKGEAKNYPKPEAGWAAEISLDLDMASAICPECHILLVEAEGEVFGGEEYASFVTLSVGNQTAVELGATAVSNSWDAYEFKEETSFDHYFDHPGVPIMVSSGDSGYSGSEYPTSSPYVVSVGGTTLKKAENTRGWSEKVWGGSGSGCSLYEPKPAWQTDSGCSKRTYADVAAVADPKTGVSVYDTYEEEGWVVYGGTSASSPIIAGVEALSTTTTRSLRAELFYLLGPQGRLFDVTEGINSVASECAYFDLETEEWKGKENYLCDGMPGYDAPTGWGTPNGPFNFLVATTEAATAVSGTKATLNATINPEGLETTYQFEYGKSTLYGTKVPVPAKGIGSGTTDVKVSEAIEGLLRGVTYHFRVVATNEGGPVYGKDETFTTPTPPTATTEAATEVSATKARLNATVNPKGLETTYQFEYGTTTSYGTKIPIPAKGIGSGTSGVKVSEAIEGLLQGTTYHFRVVATNAEGTTNGKDTTFTTLAPPTATTEAATAVSATKATLNATVNPKGLETTYQFEYGTTTSYGTNIPVPAKGIGSGTSGVKVSEAIEGLQQKTTYHFRVVATNSDGTTNGSDLTFTTLVLPTATTEVATEVSGTKATLNATVNPNGLETTYQFEYGTTTSYGTSVPVPAKGIGSGTTGVKVSEAIEGLLPGTTYHFRVVATNAGGTGVGKDKELTTEWLIVSSPNPSGATESSLEGVSCISASDCTAAGHYKESTGTIKTLGERWNGTSWTIFSTPNPIGATESSLEGVSCIPVYLCTAVGHYKESTGTIKTLGERWSGTSWTISSSPNPIGATESSLEGVSSTSTTNCTAAGHYKESTGTIKTLGERWGGEAWTLSPPRNPSGATESSLEGVSCASTTSCTAAGHYKESTGTIKTLVERWNGTSWSIFSSPNPIGATESSLEGVSCASTSDCTAAGRYKESTGTIKTLIERSGLLPPAATTEAATEVSASKARLNATVNPNGHETTYQFEYGTTTSYGTKIPVPAKGIGSGTSDVKVSEAIEGLTSKTTYHFRVVATNAEGTTNGSDQTFTTLTPPTATTEAATEVTSAKATLHATVNPNGVETTYQFEYGTTISYGTKVPIPAKGIGSGTSGVKVSETISGLEAKATYHFRVVATSAAGTAYGKDEAFTMQAPKWSIQSTPNPASGKARLVDVACVSVSECIAVGWQEGATQAFAERWKGAEWTISTPSEGGSELTDVSCGSSASCLALPISGLSVQRWNGEAWTISAAATPAGATSPLLRGVSCTSSSFCIAVGRYSNAEGKDRTLAESWNGSAWTILTTPFEEGGTNTLNAVSCTSSTSCTAIGLKGSKAIALRWNGTEWTSLAAPKEPSKISFADISCTAANACTALLGQTAKTERWNGTEWTSATLPTPEGGSLPQLFGVSCASETACTAVGKYLNAESKFRTLAESWNGSAWSVQTTPNPPGELFSATLAGVSCTLLNICTAVGSYEPVQGGESKTLAERYE